MLKRINGKTERASFRQKALQRLLSFFFPCCWARKLMMRFMTVMATGKSPFNELGIGNICPIGIYTCKKWWTC